MRSLHIRQSRLAKYLPYAIGEILLVVIGILIAVKINDWNEDRLARIAERNALLNIQEEILLDTLDLVFNLKSHSETLREEINLLSYLEGGESNLDSIDFVAALGVPLISVLHRSSAIALTNRDYDLLRNPTLKKNISRHYDFFYTALQTLENLNTDYDFYRMKLPYFTRYFELESGDKLMAVTDDSDDYVTQNHIKKAIRPPHPEQMRQDRAFAFTLSEVVYHRSLLISFYDQIIEKVHRLNAEIDSELQSRF